MMTEPSLSRLTASNPSRHVALPLMVWSLAAGWTVVLAVSLVMSLDGLTRQIDELARVQARVGWARDVLYRKWNSSHGGVYVPVSETTPSNPYLDVPDRDIVTVDGVILTKVNPAYMTRQVHEMGRLSGQVYGHITSLNPIRPENAADPWETGALRQFEDDTEEVSSIEFFEGEWHMRLMKPLVTERSCLQCHEQQGYREGDVRGGISVSVPMTPFWDVSKAQKNRLIMAHGGVWMLGFAGLLGGYRHVRRRINELDVAHQRLAEIDRRFDEVSEASRGFVWEVDASGIYHYVSDSVRVVLGYEPAELVGRKRVADLHPGLAGGPDDGGISFDVLSSRSEVVGFQHRSTTKEGEERWVSTTCRPVFGPDGALQGHLGVDADITALKQSEAEQGALREQLTQAQRLESIGQLAGGVAHDFNNMLQVVLATTELASKKADGNSALLEDLEEIRRTASKSVDLTRQLLAFARKQVIAPRILDLNNAVESILKILRRLIGESIALTWHPGHDLHPVCMDPAQVDQMLTNLCVNARDAIQGQGRITISTAAARFDGVGVKELKPGLYVKLCVEDNGSGMTDETLDHIFEPFYTTKPLGQGTGLGLATVYGIVKQNGGIIEVDSEPGRGSSFTVYLPCTEGRVESPPAPVPAPAPGSESILLVEDEPAVCRTTRKFLESQGYSVVATTSADEALIIGAHPETPIDLLITDVVMPGMSGRDLAITLQAVRPGLPCLFMSGYTSDIIASHGVLDPGIDFIEKPFGMDDLCAVVREILDRPSRRK